MQVRQRVILLNGRGICAETDSVLIEVTQHRKHAQMTYSSKLFLILSTLAIAGLGVVGCGGPAHTSTTTTSSTDRPESGGETNHTSTETTQVQTDGSQTVDHSETTQTSTPAPH